LPLALGLAHVALVAPHYFVGSFDDDASYILTARALLAGHGLTAHLANQTVVAGSYPPGYPALLVPLVWLWPHSFVPLRLLSVACYALLFPLLWVYLARHRVGAGVRVVTLVILALGPALATYGSMVMAEAPFLDLLMVLLLLVERWEREGRVWTRTGAAVVVSAAGLVWLKEAGVGVVAGLLLWLLAQRSGLFFRKAVLVGAGVAALLAPVIVARLAAGVPLAGSRYSQELGGYYHGGLLSRLVDVAPHALWQLLSTALPATLIPYLSPLPIHGHAPDVWKVLSWHVSILTVVGAIVWARRHRDAAAVIVAAYLAETLLWPYINERRVILVLPVLVAWYVVGAEAAARALVSWWRQRHGAASSLRGPAFRVAGVVAILAVAIGPLAVQLPRDYLLDAGQNTSHFGGSRYALMLARLGAPSDVVETDYLSATALFTGHLTGGLAFTNTLTSCDLSAGRAGMTIDGAGYLLLGDFNKPGVLDSPCLLSAATSSSWAVQLLQTRRDQASVFELIGPGTANPNLQDWTRLASRSALVASSGSSILEWDWSQLAPVSQVSVGEAASTASTRSVTVQLRGGAGDWRSVAAAPSAVGDGTGVVPYLLATLPAGTRATAVRLVFTGSGRPAAADVHVLGPGATS
jgi:hypothetical protein